MWAPEMGKVQSASHQLFHLSTGDTEAVNYTVWPAAGQVLGGTDCAVVETDVQGFRIGPGGEIKAAGLGRG